MNGRARIVVVAVLVALVGQPARPAHGENFFVRKLKGAGRAIGGLLGAPVGGLVEAAATPTIRSAEGSGRRLLYDFEGVAARRIDQAGTVVDRVVDNAFDNTGKLVRTVDVSLEARILQVTTGVNQTVDNVGEEARATIGAADKMIAANIARARGAAIAVLDRVDKLAADRLAQVDEIVRLRLGDVGQLVHTTLAQVDEIAKARIDQLDEVAGRRIGNIDVVATKQTLSLEAMLLRLATLVGVFVFFAFLMWSVWNNFVTNSNTIDTIREDGTTRDERRTIKRKLVLWGLQTVAAAVCIGAVIAGGYYLPRDSEKRSAAQVAEHSTALVNAARLYEFTAVKYHHSQLELLQPGDPTWRGIAKKADLLRDLFGRPARLQTAEGLREIEAELDAVRALVPDDPDLKVLEAYVIWQVGTSREDELDAADLCVQALAARAGGFRDRFLPTHFMLRALAESYIRNFMHDPYDPHPDERDTYERIKRTADTLPPQSHLAQLQQVFAYDELVATLDLKVGPAYLAMLDAHAEYERLAAVKPVTAAAAAATKTALDARTVKAELVVQAWEEFDRALAASPWLAGDPASLNAFTLDDSVLSHALYFWVEARAKSPKPTLPPPYFGAPPRTTPAGKPGGTADDPVAVRRAATAPMRIRWANRWSPLLGKTTQDVIAKEEADRYAALEKRSLELMRAYLAYRKAATAGTDVQAIKTTAVAAAKASAAMGLFTGEGVTRTPAAKQILTEATTLGATFDAAVTEAVDELGRVRRIRFL